MPTTRRILWLSSSSGGRPKPNGPVGAGGSGGGGGGGAAVEVERVPGALAGAPRGGEVRRRLGVVRGRDAPFRGVAWGVVLVGLLGVFVVGRPPLPPPRRAPDLRALQ